MLVSIHQQIWAISKASTVRTIHLTFLTVVLTTTVSQNVPTYLQSDATVCIDSLWWLGTFTHCYLICVGPTSCVEGDVRLVSGYLQQEGRLELCLRGVWSTICDTNFDQSDALVACAKLGYEVAGNNTVYNSCHFSCAIIV